MAFSIPAFAKDETILQKIFDASASRVYAAEVQAAGATLKNTVKEACLVNFETREVHPNQYGGFYRTILWSATCHDAGNGKTTVTLSVQVNSNMFGNDRAKKKNADVFWANMDTALKTSNYASSDASTSPAQTDQANVTMMQITSEPSGADIAVDGDYAGNTPSQLKLKPGSHTLKITENGFQPWERSVHVEAGESRTISAHLEKSSQ
jgi:PEGA domain-containing protein